MGLIPIDIPGPLDELLEIAVFVYVLRAKGLVSLGSDLLRGLGGGVRAALDDLGYDRFRQFWVPGRLIVSLQLRLFVESVLFSMGKPWSDLVSGFKPLRWELGPRDDVTGPTTASQIQTSVAALVTGVTDIAKRFRP